MTTKTFTRSFAGGEISPLLYGRLDLAKNQTGLAKCLNFLVTPQGPVENRPGFEYVVHARGSVAALIPFTFNTVQSFALEFGDEYIRFHTAGGTLLEASKPITAITVASPGVFTSAAHGYTVGKWVFLADIGGMPTISGRWGIVASAPTADTFVLTDLFGDLINTTGSPAYTGGGTVSAVYEINSPYAVEDVFDLHYVQSADVLTIVHQAYEPRELRRLGATNWTLATIPFVPSVATPGAPTAAARGPGGGTPIVHTYAVTALATSTLEESQASASVAVNNDLSVAGNYNTVQPQAVTGAARFNIYKLKSGIYGFVGQSDGSAFRDDNVEPDVSKTPPLAANPFAVGAIVSVPITNGGSSYLSTASTGGDITSITVTAGGTGYTSAPAVTASGAGGTGTGAVLTASVALGVVGSIAVTNAGSGYVSPVTITISGGGGSGATATAAANPVVDNTVRAVISDGGGPGTGALIQPVVIGGAVVGVQVLAAGSGYTTPSVTVTNAAGGTGAVFGTPVITGADVHPGAVSYYEQRRIFGGTAGSPQTIWATRSGTESNMSYSIPTQDDDAITARIVAREAQTVRHLVPMGELLALTSGGVWKISSSDGGAITPATFSVRPQSYVGASNAQPITTSDSVLYVQARGSHAREISYSWQAQKYTSADLSLLAPHLFDFKSIGQLAFSATPYQVLWSVRSDGVLLGNTYQPEHEVKAWHQHATAGTFESVCSIPEGNEDGVYVVVRRTINGTTMAYIERMHSRQFATLADAFFVDCGASYSGAPATVIRGLNHLEGESVAILADGGVQPVQTVTAGQVTLSSPASTVHVGLPYDCDAQTMPLASEALAAFGQGVAKNVNKVWLSVLQSSSIKAGPSFTRLRSYVQRTVEELYGSPPALKTGMAEITLDPQWQQEGSLCIRQSDPLPLTLRALTLETATGG